MNQNEKPKKKQQQKPEEEVQGGMEIDIREEVFRPAVRDMLEEGEPSEQALQLAVDSSQRRTPTAG